MSRNSTDWREVSLGVLAGGELTRAQALAALDPTADDLLDLLAGAYRIRAHHHGRRVRINVLNNAKSGVCAEDCAFCSQSARAESEIETWPMRSAAELVDGARRAAAGGAATYCIVTGMSRPTPAAMETIREAARAIKAELPLKICTSLGLLDTGQAEALAEAGVDRYNHNLETSERHYPAICTTHGWKDRVHTVEAAKGAGLEVCCGGIVGLGESTEDRVDLAFKLRDLRVESIPVNFLDPRPGTRLADLPRPSPTECLRALALFRLANPQAIDVRAAGGREACLGAMQPLALFAANSLFAGGYLTTGGQGLEEDLAMISDAGFTPEVTTE